MYKLEQFVISSLATVVACHLANWENQSPPSLPPSLLDLKLYKEKCGKKCIGMVWVAVCISDEVTYLCGAMYV